LKSSRVASPATPATPKDADIHLAGREKTFRDIAGKFRYPNEVLQANRMGHSVLTSRQGHPSVEGKRVKPGMVHLNIFLECFVWWKSVLRAICLLDFDDYNYYFRIAFK
jgi:hypothetical protein